MNSALVDLFGYSSEDEIVEATTIISATSKLEQLPPEVEEGNIEYKV